MRTSKRKKIIKNLRNNKGKKIIYTIKPQDCEDDVKELCENQGEFKDPDCHTQGFKICI